MNKTTNPINFKHESKTIEITKKFYKEANIYNSVAYKQLCGIKKDFPDYEIRIKEIKKSASKRTYKGLTIKEMERFIATRTPEEQSYFEKVKAIAKAKPSMYATLRKWFLDRYKDEYNEELSVPEVEAEDIVAEDDVA